MLKIFRSAKAFQNTPEVKPENNPKELQKVRNDYSFTKTENI